ncbi:MAG: hypothetical protein P4L74_01735 [Candidatus Doudnabacteria bacterium]|nr:hypothetical protein [Candidatus Doudnabacteria bacterium]
MLAKQNASTLIGQRQNKGSPPQAAGYYCKEQLHLRGKPRGIEPFFPPKADPPPAEAPCLAAGRPRLACPLKDKGQTRLRRE